MKPSQKCINFIKHFESLVLHPYDDGLGYMTIGWGHRILDGEHFTTITEAEAEAILAKDIAKHERIFSRLLRFEIKQHQYDALTSLAFNAPAAFMPGTGVYSKIRDRERFDLISSEFGRWIIGTVNKKKVVLDGLIDRRHQENLLFRGRL